MGCHKCGVNFACFTPRLSLQHPLCSLTLSMLCGSEAPLLHLSNGMVEVPRPAAGSALMPVSDLLWHQPGGGAQEHCF